MSALSRRLRLVVALVMCCAWQASATTYRLMSPSQVLVEADLVFLGTVTDIVVENRSGEPWTLVTFRLDELLSGFGFDPGADPLDDGSDEDTDPDGALAPAPATVTLAFLGGATTGAELLIAGAPAWRFDEEYLVAAYDQADLASPLVGFRQGLWRVQDTGVVDLDGVALAVADDGSLVRAGDGATLPQVLRAIQGLLTGGAVPGEGAADEGSAPATAEPVDGSTAQPSETSAAGTSPAAATDDADREDGEPLAAPDRAGSPDDTATVVTPVVSALQVDYDVDDGGGPLLLSDKVVRAVAAWTSAVSGRVDLRVQRSADSRNHVRYGREELFGADTYSLTTVAPGGVVTALVSPAAAGLTHTVLVHELGVLLGVPEGGAGVMANAIGAPRDGPTDLDVAELAALSLYHPADLTRDGQVDFYDLLALAAAFGESGVNVIGDLDGNGVVDVDDVEVLRERYQFEPPR